MSSNPHQIQPTIKDYESIFASSNDVTDFSNNISNLFPDYIHKNFDTSPFSDRKVQNQVNAILKDGSEFEKELISQKAFIDNQQKALFLRTSQEISDANNMFCNNDESQSKLTNYVKTEVVDSIIDSFIISKLLPFSSNKTKKSKFLNDVINKKKISSINEKIIENEKVQKLVQKRISSLSAGKLRSENEETDKKKMRFVSPSKIKLKSILKNSNSKQSLIKKSQDDNIIFFDKIDPNSRQPLIKKNQDDKSIESNKSKKRVHFIPDKNDVIPADATVFDYKESAKIMKKTREEERELRKREEELMKKIKNDFLTKQKSTKNKYFTSTLNQPPPQHPSHEFEISLKSKQRPRSKSAKTRSKQKTANLSSSLYPSYYNSKVTPTETNLGEKDDRVIRKKTRLRSNSPQISYRPQCNENSNLVPKGKSQPNKEKPKTKPKHKQSKPKFRSVYDY